MCGVIWKLKIKEVKWKKMNGKNLVELRIPTEEVENVDELVSEGYYESRSDAIRDIIRRGAVHVRARYPLHAGDEKRKRAVEEKETVKENLAPTLTTRVQAYIYDEKSKSLNRDTGIFINRFVGKKTNLEI